VQTSEAVVEFLIPGVMTCFPLSLLVLRGMGFIGPRSLQFTDILATSNIAVATVLLSLFLALSYVVGIILNEVGTMVVKNQSNRLVCSCIQEYKDILMKYKYHELRSVDIDTLKPSRAWAEFSFLRAYCRIASAEAASRIKSHGNFLRVLRPSIISFPSFLILFGIFILSLSTTDLLGYGFLISGVVSYLLIRAAYFQRLHTATKSVIQHYVAICAQKEENPLYSGKSLPVPTD
jgi:hypothetical protein